jgi:hypothetical protein|tara:strand:+ start:619 stop:1128 length:510 start_codon:yes stop_codon:yes gene_type:complete
MALFGGTRDVSLIKKINRELMGNIITQQCAFYKYRLEQTTINIYGEAAGGKYFDGPTLFNALIVRQNQEYPESDLGVDFKWGIEFRFLRADLVDAEVVAEIGDIILYQEGYYEVTNINSNQYFVGKNPSYPNATNPLNPGLEGFGGNLSTICNTIYVPGDKLGITQERL